MTTRFLLQPSLSPIKAEQQKHTFVQFRIASQTCCSASNLLKAIQQKVPVKVWYFVFIDTQQHDTDYRNSPPQFYICTSTIGED